MKKIFLLMGLLLFTSSLTAKDWYVVAGKDGLGTKKKPLGLIQDALNMATSGDVIHIARGFYTGEEGVGKWLIQTPNLTLVGGYSSDFKQRNPFVYPTVLMRAMNDFGSLSECKKRNHTYHPMKKTTAGYNPGPMISGVRTHYTSHENTILDGLVLDGHTRNLYQKDGSLRLDKGAIGAPLIDFTDRGCKVRNCVLLNSSGGGIRIAAMGKRGEPSTYTEVSNCLIINVLMFAINCEIGEGVAVIKNNTCAFVWNYLNNGYGLIIGSKNHLRVEKNIFYNAERTGLNNSRLNRWTRLKTNLFWKNKKGAYRFFSPHSKSFLLITKPEKFTGLKGSLRYLISSESKDNVASDPQLQVAPQYLFLINHKARAPIYNQYSLFSKIIKDRGTLQKVKWRAYQSKNSPKSTAAYLPVAYGDIKGILWPKIEQSGKKGLRVSFETSLHNQASSGFYLSGVTEQNYYCFRSKGILLYLYVRKGSPALKAFVRAKKEGSVLSIKGTLYNVTSRTFAPRSVAVVVDEAIEKE